MALADAMQQLQAGGAATAPPPAANFNLPTPSIAPISPPAPSAPAPAAAPPAVTAILAQSDPGFDAFWAKMVPGESGGKDVPNFRYDPTHTASGTAQLTDTNWKAFAPRLGIDITRYPTAMSAPEEWQKATAKLLHRAYGPTPWDKQHGGSLDAYPGYEFLQNIRQGYTKEAGDLNDQARAAIAKIGAADQDVDKMMARVREATDRSDRAQDAAMKAIAKAPANPEIDGVKHMSGLATIVGLLGGAFTKTPMLTSLNAAAAAISSYNAGDLNNYKIAYNNWKTQTDLLFKIADMNAHRVRDIVSDEKMGVEEKRANLDAYLRAAGLSQLADETRIKGDSAALDWSEKMFNAKQQADLRQAQIDSTNAFREATLANKGWAFWQDKDGTIYRVNSGTGEIQKAAPELQGGGPVGKGGSAAGAVLDKQTLGTMADQYIAGDKSVLQGLGYGNVGAQNRAALRTMISQKMMSRAADDFRAQHGRDPTEGEKEQLSADIGRQLALSIAEFGGLQQAERTGYGRVATLTMGAAEAEQFTPIALDISNRIDRSQFPSLNRLQLATAEGTGNTDVVRFTEANVALIDAYAQVIGRGNAQLTDAARQQATNLLNTNWSKEQYAAAVNQINVEIQGALRAPSDMLQRFRDSFAVGGKLPELAAGRPPQLTGPPHPPVPASLQGKPNLQWSPTLRQWRVGDKLYDETGQPVP